MQTLHGSVPVLSLQQRDSGNLAVLPGITSKQPQESISFSHVTL
jgi:hypothetical protein